MKSLPHIVHDLSPETGKYTYTGSGGSTTYNTPPRDDRPGHGGKLIREFQQARTDVDQTDKQMQRATERAGTPIEVKSEQGFDLLFERLDRRRDGIELLNVRVIGGITHATIFVRSGKEGKLISLLEDYVQKDTRFGKPKNKALVESISEIKLAALSSFWTDAQPFPSTDQKFWWEVWLNSSGEDSGIYESFKDVAENVGLKVSKRSVKFPERVVLIAFGSKSDFVEIQGLFDFIAELRKAKEVISEYLELAPSEQKQFVDDALKRIRFPSAKAPAVCLLDTGVTRGHPLLEQAIREEDVQACGPNWRVDDVNDGFGGHGTEMAGLSLYGCLSAILSVNQEIELSHRLESVKILPDKGQNDPEHWGAITQEAVARAETVAPTRKRTVCMTVTSDSRDEGFPTSWSGAIDQLTSGELDSRRRLLIVSAGNIIPRVVRNEYPNRNHTEGIKNPGQSWNAVTVGAYTERVTISDGDLADWQPLGNKGKLSPCSTTSICWEKDEWPYKPDIVVEGGNDIVHPDSREVDSCEDLSLLTTKARHPGGSFLVSTGDTSAAAAQASRFAAILQSEYPDFWPETIRALLIHSAEWTPEMLEEFPRNDRRNRLRCYGFGVPNLERARASANNFVTLVSQQHIQPYAKIDGRIQSNEIHFHELPWPIDVLRELGDTQVRMKVTLSYYIEPSPGRLGWENKFRYASHGLRFDVKRPLESLDNFKQRCTKSEWEDPNSRPETSTQPQNWELGSKVRARGSIHSDSWNGTGSELADAGYVAVFPVTGWWKERKHLEGWAKLARYSLVVSIQSEEAEADLYTPITQAVHQRIDIANNIEIEVE